MREISINIQKNQMAKHDQAEGQNALPVMQMGKKKFKNGKSLLLKKEIIMKKEKGMRV